MQRGGILRGRVCADRKIGGAISTLSTRYRTRSARDLAAGV